MAADLASASKACDKKEVDALTAEVEKKLKCIGELENVEMKEDLTDTEATLMADKDFVANLEKAV